MLRDNSQSRQPPDAEGIERSRRGYKEQLALRISVALAKGDYKTKNNTEKIKTCSQCKKNFHGREDQDTCGPKCRMAKSRA